MRSLIMAVLAAALLACSCRSQEQAMVYEGGSSSVQPKPLDDHWNKWLVGEWEVVAGESSVTDESGEVATIDLNEQEAGGFKIEFGLNGQFLIMETWAETGEMTPDQMKYFKDTLNYSDEDIEGLQRNPFKALLIHTIDPRSGEIIGHLFDSMRCVAQGRGRRQGNKEIIEWKWSVTAQGATSVSTMEKVNDNEFIYNHKYILPNGNKMEDRVEFVRVQ